MNDRASCVPDQSGAAVTAAPPQAPSGAAEPKMILTLGLPERVVPVGDGRLNQASGSTFAPAVWDMPPH